MTDHIFVQGIPSSEQLQAILASTRTADLKDVNISYDQRMHPISGVGLVIAVQHADQQKVSEAKTLWVKELAKLGFRSGLS